MNGNFPIIAIEVVLVFGGVLLFGWWQLRSIRRDQADQADSAARRLREQENAKPRDGPLD